MAEEAGFEPATELPLCHLSRVVPSTAQPLIRIKYLKKLGISETLHYIVPSHFSPNEIASIKALTNLRLQKEIQSYDRCRLKFRWTPILGNLSIKARGCWAGAYTLSLQKANSMNELAQIKKIN